MYDIVEGYHYLDVALVQDIILQELCGYIMFTMTATPDTTPGCANPYMICTWNHTSKMGFQQI